MLLVLIILPFTLVSILLFIIMEIKQKNIYIVFKGLSTLSIAMIALLTHQSNLYSQFLIAGLFMSLIGDILLEFRYQNPNLLQAGGASFIGAHILYILAFTQLSPLRITDLIIMAILLMVGIGLFLYIKPPKLEDKLLTIGYIIIISFMVSKAITIAFTDITLSLKKTIIIGAILFYLSDIEIAIHLYKKPIPYSMIWNSLLYFPAQILIALSVVIR